jgi:RNA polymerase sigma-70 factor (ECF subfamily)
LVLLENQDRSLWNQAYIREGSALVEQALSKKLVGAYCVQAAIAAVHANATSAEATDWAEIVALYDVLFSINPSPVIELNRAVAFAMRDGAATGLKLINQILAKNQLNNYHLAHSARADLLRRLGQKDEAQSAYETALKLAQMEPEKRFLKGRLRELADS